MTPRPRRPVHVTPGAPIVPLDPDSAEGRRVHAHCSAVLARVQARLDAEAAQREARPA